MEYIDSSKYFEFHNNYSTYVKGLSIEVADKAQLCQFFVRFKIKDRYMNSSCFDRKNFESALSSF